MGLARQFGYSSLGSVGSKAINFVVFILLARMLAPENFGLMAILTLVGGALRIFVQLGIGAALVHAREMSPRLVGSGFATNIIVGLLMALLFFCLSSIISDFYSNPEIARFVVLYAPILVLFSLSVVPMALLQKAGRFKAISSVELSAQLSAGVVGVLMALSHPLQGTYALIGMAYCYTGLVSLMSLFLTRKEMAIAFDRESFSYLVGYVRYLIGSRFLNYGVANVDKLVVSKLVDSATFGLYSMAYRIVSLLPEIVSLAVNRVLFSRYSQLQDDHAAVRKLHIAAVKCVALICFPFSFALITLADPIVRVLLGDAWSGMVYMLQLLAIITLLQPITILNGAIYLSQGRTRLQFFVGLFIKSANILGILIGSLWGIEGVFAGMVATMLMSLVPSLHFSGKSIGLRFYVPLLSLVSIIVPSFLAAVTAWWVSAYLLQAGGVLHLAVLLLVGAVVYFFGAIAMNRKLLLGLVGRSVG
ncbi:lipopolysaccharide biosynthesis protein [Aestuariirhabdus sp. LZHN29]|uniref:lipopolysaccharide biosynthesis protein n=1 Tax=Aestuariirhabdus sp. LZHN29 TaxID=3417462 RepID=UPI003CE92780